MFEKLYKKIFPIIKFIPPEIAHNLAIKFFSNFRKEIKSDDPILSTKICNLQFANPIGLAAGFDKNGEAYKGLMSLGFGFVEIGTITINPQYGNYQFMFEGCGTYNTINVIFESEPPVLISPEQNVNERVIESEVELLSFWLSGG